MLPTPSPEVILSLLTAIVAFLTFWFTYLKGPDIDLLSRPQATYAAPDDSPWRVPDQILLRPLQLVFANHGSRSGVIADLRVDLAPAAQLRAYLTGVECEVHSSEVPASFPSQRNRQPHAIAIRQGESIVVNVTCRIRTIAWKDYPRALDPSRRLRDAFQDALDRHWAGFVSFIQAVAGNQALGQLTVNVSVTVRGWNWRTRLEDRQVAEVSLPTLPEEWVRLFQKTQSLWPDLRPSLQDVVKDAVGQVRALRESIRPGLERLGKPLEAHDLFALRVDELNRWYRRDTAYPWLSDLHQALQGWNVELAAHLQRYRQAAERFNLEVERFQLRQAIPGGDVAPLQQVANEIRPMVAATVKALDHLEEELVKVM